MRLIKSFTPSLRKIKRRVNSLYHSDDNESIKGTKQPQLEEQNGHVTV
jgi:hypothetical protein